MVHPLRTVGLPVLIFASRWVQVPLYLGMIAAQVYFVIHFFEELVNLVAATFGDKAAVEALVNNIGYRSAPGWVPALDQTVMTLMVLGLIDVVMLCNLLIMVIVGGYDTFISRIRLQGHPDQPQWVRQINASVLKLKLSTAIICISAIHLLKTFLNAGNYSEKTLLWQTVIHVALIASAITIAMVDRSAAAGASPVARR